MRGARHLRPLVHPLRSWQEMTRTKRFVRWADEHWFALLVAVGAVLLTGMFVVAIGKGS